MRDRRGMGVAGEAELWYIINILVISIGYLAVLSIPGADGSPEGLRKGGGMRIGAAICGLGFAVWAIDDFLGMEIHRRKPSRKDVRVWQRERAPWEAVLSGACWVCCFCRMRSVPWWLAAAAFLLGMLMLWRIDRRAFGK